MYKISVLQLLGFSVKCTRWIFLLGMKLTKEWATNFDKKIKLKYIQTRIQVSNQNYFCIKLLNHMEMHKIDLLWSRDYKENIA